VVMFNSVVLCFGCGFMIVLVFVLGFGFGVWVLIVGIL